jgi:hypothetical protein
MRPRAETRRGCATGGGPAAFGWQAAQQGCSHPDQGQSDQHDGQATRRFAPPLLAIGVGYATTNGT